MDVQHIRGSEQQHLKAFGKAGVQFMVHHIGHPVTADHKPAIQIVHSAKEELPGTLAEAISCMEKDRFMRETLGDHVFENLKRHGKTHHIAKVALLQHIRGSEQQHLKAFGKAGVGDHVFEKYISLKKEEWNRYRSQVTDWEISEYLNRF